MDRKGILLLNKPVGPGSMDMLRRLRRLTGMKKMGHVGTLDPFADGLLPVVLGRDTKIIPYMENYKKAYRVTIAFGQQTETQDFTGKALTPLTFSDSFSPQKFRLELEETVLSMTGPIEQKTPAYSAAKIQGKPMYTYARQGIKVEGKRRKVEIFEAKIIDVSIRPERIGLELPLDFSSPHPLYPKEVREEGVEPGQGLYQSPIEVSLDIHCSKGTYIRTWAHDLGERLGLGAYALRLRRLQTGPYHWEQGIAWSEMCGGSLPFPVIGPDTARPDLPVIELSLDDAVCILQGKTVYRDVSVSTLCRAYFGEEFLGLVRPGEKTGTLRAERMFAELENLKN